MHEDKLYHYAVIRLVPRVEREEFFNIGLILFCKNDKYIRFEYHLCTEKFRLMQSETDYEEVIESLETHGEIAKGTKGYGPIAELDIPDRFDGSQRCEVHHTSLAGTHGKTKDLDETFDGCLKNW